MECCLVCGEWDYENDLCKQGNYQFSCKKYIQESFAEIKDFISERDIKLIDYYELYKLFYDDIVTGYLVFDLNDFIDEILETVKKDKISNLKKICEDTHHAIISRYREHKDYLNNIFDQYTGNLQNDDLPIYMNFIFLYYPQFKTDLEILKTMPIKKPFITKTENSLQWAYSKKSLSEYFGYLPKPGKIEHKWHIIEKVFNETGLKNSFSTNGKGSKKLSKDYELLLEILKKYPQP
jgi:hypothetical protein